MTAAKTTGTARKSAAPALTATAQAQQHHPSALAINAPVIPVATQGAPLKTSTGKDELVRVNVPKKFNFVTPDHLMHTYGAGEQNMRRSIAEASYSVSHGVEIIGDAE